MFIILAVIAAALVYCGKYWHDGTEALAATNAWCDANEAFFDWRLQNPSVYIGLSSKARMLLSKELESYEWFLRTHSFIDGTERRAYLTSLFDDLPPKYPRDQKPTALSRSNEVGFFIAKFPKTK